MDLQAKIAYLEAELDEIDAQECASNDSNTKMRLRWVEEDVAAHKDAPSGTRTRQMVFDELRKLVLEYGR